MMRWGTGKNGRRESAVATPKWEQPKEEEEEEVVVPFLIISVTVDHFNSSIKASAGVSKLLFAFKNK